MPPAAESCRKSPCAATAQQTVSPTPTRRPPSRPPPALRPTQRSPTATGATPRASAGPASPVAVRSLAAGASSLLKIPLLPQQLRRPKPALAIESLSSSRTRLSREVKRSIPTDKIINSMLIIKTTLLTLI
ncbi:hypothetical protein BOX15_Mlig012604g2 [Macrostomum lignano]|uniref:Uncharacterized protein n=1 Tax=Macrostomum lignano TaxID=282301 RepID=A0A267DGC1_9PLAT|nr:hypothetical protein BOX15_Mlig012604g2 [Macrostomum lignano]